MKNHERSFTPALTKLCVGLAVVGLVGCGGSSGGSNKSSSAASVAPSSVAASSIAPSSTPASSVAPSSISASSSSAAPEWKLVWSDEFDGTVIDSGKWGFEKNCWGGGNNEQQCYTDQATNAFVADGILNIVAIKEDFTGPNTPEGTGNTTATLPYTSARLRTKNIKEWTFGRFEIRAKLPSGQGTWPAIWMLPTDSPYGTWASSGEIDIMEAVNLKVVTDGSAPEAAVHGTLHYGRNWPGNVNAGAAYTLPGNVNPADDFHEYALEWEEGEIRWYVDDVHFATQRDTGWYGQYMVDGKLTDAPAGAPFDRHSKFHMLLNLAVGGNWAGNVNNKGVDASVFPQKMLVDYVRVYECTGSSETGKGCATIGENAEIVKGHRRPGIGKVDFDGPPLLVMYGDEVRDGLFLNSYTTGANQISYSEIDEAGRGKVLNVIKTGTTGNVYLEVDGDPADLTNWSGTSELVFDVKVNSKADGAKLLVKLDSGWPSVSDVSVPLATNGEWKEYRIALATLIANGNSFEAGKAKLAAIKNMFVIDPSTTMNVSFDNIRIEGSASSGVPEFAPLPLFTVYGDAPGAGLDIAVYKPENVSTSSVAEAGRGNVFKIVKTSADGNVSFHVTSGDAVLSHWAAKGELVFSYKVNSKANGTTLLVKMDSEWPNVSDVSVPLLADGVWNEFRIDVADLIDNGNSNSCCPGSANLNSIINIVVIEPSGVMDIVFDDIRFVEKQ